MIGEDVMAPHSETDQLRERYAGVPQYEPPNEARTAHIDHHESCRPAISLFRCENKWRLKFRQNLYIWRPVGSASLCLCELRTVRRGRPARDETWADRCPGESRGPCVPGMLLNLEVQVLCGPQGAEPLAKSLPLA